MDRFLAPMPDIKRILAWELFDIVHIGVRQQRSEEENARVAQTRARPAIPVRSRQFEISGAVADTMNSKVRYVTGYHCRKILAGVCHKHVWLQEWLTTKSGLYYPKAELAAIMDEVDAFLATKLEQAPQMSTSQMRDLLRNSWAEAEVLVSSQWFTLRQSCPKPDPDSLKIAEYAFTKVLRGYLNSRVDDYLHATGLHVKCQRESSDTLSEL
eukprot:TRINITY_DN5120_c0_g1_i1.p2 TRINITY_DN5120_c0_g1~~TRINITY_DN5120_c0_g1_i1.p2  ORF type:complete len:246 (-),score=46.74 TRINITY_DN5120_c0_g1_i1:629-1264(-)